MAPGQPTKPLLLSVGVGEGLLGRREHHCKRARSRRERLSAMISESRAGWWWANGWGSGPQPGQGLLPLTTPWAGCLSALGAGILGWGSDGPISAGRTCGPRPGLNAISWEAGQGFREGGRTWGDIWQQEFFCLRRRCCPVHGHVSPPPELPWRLSFDEGNLAGPGGVNWGCRFERAPVAAPGQVGGDCPSPVRDLPAPAQTGGRFPPAQGVAREGLDQESRPGLGAKVR